MTSDMWLEGKVFKHGKNKCWAVEIPALYAHTQGRTKKDAYLMAIDLVNTMAADMGLKFRVKIKIGKDDEFYITGAPYMKFMPFILRRQRQSQGLSIADVTKRMGVKSRNTYARYEQGKTEPTLSRFNQIMAVLNRDAVPAFNIGMPKKGPASRIKQVLGNLQSSKRVTGAKPGKTPAVTRSRKITTPITSNVRKAVG